MIVKLTNLYASALVVPAPFDVTIAVGANVDLPIHVRDIVEYRANPARTDNLREIEQMVKDQKLLITPVSRDANDLDLEELLLSMSGGGYNQKGIEVVPGPAPAVTIPLNADMPGPYRINNITLDSVGGAPVPYEVTNLIAGSFDVVFAAPWGPGQIHWEAEYPV